MNKRTYPEIDGDPWTPKLRDYINGLEAQNAKLLEALAGSVREHGHNEFCSACEQDRAAIVSVEGEGK